MIESWHPDFVLTVGDNAYPLGSRGAARSRHLRPVRGGHARSRPGSRRSATTTSRRTAGSRARGVPLARQRALVPLHLGERGRGRAGLRRLGGPRLAAAALRPQRTGARLLLPLRRLASPALGAPGRPSQPGLRRNIVPLVEKDGVQVVFVGHLHAYARSRPRNGVVYVAVGTGGAELDNDARKLTIPSRPHRPGPLRRTAGGRRGSRGALQLRDGRRQRCATTSACVRRQHLGDARITVMASTLVLVEAERGQRQG